MNLDSNAIPTEPHLLADHLALDLLNTEAEIDGERIDFWQTGEDVLRWLVRVGVTDRATCTPADADPLLAQARALRRVARRLIELRKQGCRADPRSLNAWLKEYRRYPMLTWPPAGAPQLAWKSGGEAGGQWLGAVALAVAELVVEADFQLVRQCEHPECILWFYDRTKGHRRKWCSMALCGNRHKVASHRKRKSA